MPQLDIFLKVSDSLFNFSDQDFEPLRAAIPSLQLKFHDSEADLLSALPDIEYLDTWFFQSEWYERAPRLKHLFTPAAGKNFVKTHPEVPVQFGAFHGPLMAETTLGLILNFTLRLPEFRQQQNQHLWQRLPLRRLAGQTALILGYGAIGQTCGQLLSQFGMQVYGTKRQPETDTDGPVRMVSISDLPKYLPMADHVISFLPGNTDTAGFLSEERLQLFAPHAYFYNLGRGTTVDEAALVTALDREQLAGAALDVTEIEPLPSESPLWDHEKVVLLPHSSAYFEEYRRAHVTELTESIKSLPDLRREN